MDTHICDQLIFDKEAKNTQWGIVSSTNGAGKTGYPHTEGKLDTCLTQNLTPNGLEISMEDPKL